MKIVWVIAEGIVFNVSPQKENWAAKNPAGVGAIILSK
jgi:hypothetical protein